LNKIEILVLTDVLPTIKTPPILYVEHVLESLREKTPTKITWVIYQPDKIETFDEQDTSIRDIHEFSNGLELLENLNPDVVMVGMAIEPISYSISTSAKFLGIPLIAFEGTIPSTEYVKNTKNYSTSQVARKFFSDQIPSDSTEQKQFMRRGKFIFYKYFFLLKTKRVLKIGYLQIILAFFKDLNSHLSGKSLPLNKLADLVLVTYESLTDSFLKEGFRKEQLKVVGNPLLDKIHELLVRKKTSAINNDIKILIMTDPLYEHGFWSSIQRTEFLEQLFKELQNDEEISFTIKIHPSSENIEYYKKLLGDLNINSEIFQSENLWDIIYDFDMVISFGFSNAHTIVAYSGMKMILLDTRLDMPIMELVKEGITSGHIKQCRQIENLIPLIHNFKNQKVHLTQDFIRERNKLFFQFDGKSSERIAESIVNLIERRNSI